MSDRHTTIFKGIAQEYLDVVTALQGARQLKRGSKGNPSFNPQLLPDAIPTLGDAYALLLIATGEEFLREYLNSLGIPAGTKPKLHNLIDQAFKALNTGQTRISRSDKISFHELRHRRNEYAHGYEKGKFPSVPTIAATLSKFFHNFP